MFHKEKLLVQGKLVPFIHGEGGGGKGCFIGHTLIDMADGSYKYLKNIIIGDMVKSFDETGQLSANKVTDIFFHPDQEVIWIFCYGDKICATPNHWALTENNTFKELKDFKIGEPLVLANNEKRPITSINAPHREDVYNITVENDHTFFANGIAVHNKGGGKGAIEAENTLFSTDILFVSIALGEGPIYRVNPNGPQDIEMNENSIDNLIYLDTTGGVNTDLFFYTYVSGTTNQACIDLFGDSIVVPQNLANPINLKKGNISGIPRTMLTLQNTSSSLALDKLVFKFVINTLLRMDENGNTNGYLVTPRVHVYNSTSTRLIGSYERTIEGKTTTQYKFEIEVWIPEAERSVDGYKFSVEKASDDSSNSKVQDAITFYGWDEIVISKFSYPMTSIIGYALLASDEYKGSVPNITSLVKGLLCKVPSNYNQPILSNSEIDWREVETTAAERVTYGYRQQSTGMSVLNNSYPSIYSGLWDGTFVRSWTQNPVWIVYDLLTNRSYGLGIPEKNIDKYNFYRVARYCDAVDSEGLFVGVDGFSDGSYRYKPRDTHTGVRNLLIGIPSGRLIKERRFICDISISSQKQILDIIQLVTGLFRGILYYSSGKLVLNVDMPDELPVAVFNETNILPDSLNISGTKESDIITGVEVTYIDPTNHYRRETMRIDDDVTLRELNHIENLKQIELTGCTRRGQAVRFAQYLLASGKYLRRKISFRTSLNALNLTAGDVISVSLRVPGTAWGYAGRVFMDAAVNDSYVYLEHFTTPTMSISTITGNTKPLALRIIKKDTDKVDFYLVSNTVYELLNTGNASTGYDVANVKMTHHYNPSTGTYSTPTWTATSAPERGDLWTFGEVNPGDIYTSTTDKLFKITNIEKDADADSELSIDALEYISNIYIDSDTAIAYTPNTYKNLISPLTAPPAPILALQSRPVTSSDGSVSYDVDIFSTTDTIGYPISIKTMYEISYPDDLLDIIG